MKLHARGSVHPYVMFPSGTRVASFASNSKRYNVHRNKSVLPNAFNRCLFNC